MLVGTNITNACIYAYFTIGNCYTGSVFASLLSVVAGQGEGLSGHRVLMFSYGSGSMASMYRYVSVYYAYNRVLLLCLRV